MEWNLIWKIRPRYKAISGHIFGGFEDWENVEVQTEEDAKLSQESFLAQVWSSSYLSLNVLIDFFL